MGIPFESILCFINTHTHTDDVRCILCRDVLYQPVTLTCGHIFCRRCILQQMQATVESVELIQENEIPQEFECSVCRKAITELPMLFNAPAASLLNAYFQQNPEVEERLRQDYREINNEKFRRQYAEYERLLAEGNERLAAINERRIIAQANEGRINAERDDEGFVNARSIVPGID